MAPISIKRIADNINEYCEQGKFFWACGLVKETASLWTTDRITMLCEDAQTMATYYRDNAHDQKA